MRAVVIERPGPPEDLSIRPIHPPDMRPQDILVRVEVAGVNPADCKMAAMGKQAGFVLPLPHVPGRDCVGRIEAMGEEVRGFRIGDRVLGVAERGRWGCHAELAALPAAQACLLPEEIPAREAAALPTPGVSALACLADAGGIGRGMRVLIPGPLGGVGRVAMALARQAGAEITALIRGDGDPAPALVLGAAHVHRHVQDVPPASQDLALDQLGGVMHAALARTLRPGGVLACLSADPVPGDAVLPAGIVVRRPPVLASPGKLQQLLQLLQSGALDGMLERAYPLAGAREAYRAMMTGGRRGRIVLDLH